MKNCQDSLEKDLLSKKRIILILNHEICKTNDRNSTLKNNFESQKRLLKTKEKDVHDLEKKIECQENLRKIN